LNQGALCVYFDEKYFGSAMKNSIESKKIYKKSSLAHELLNRSSILGL
jgi:hypothetical protein